MTCLTKEAVGGLDRLFTPGVPHGGGQKLTAYVAIASAWLDKLPGPVPHTALTGTPHRVTLTSEKAG